MMKRLLPLVTASTVVCLPLGTLNADDEVQDILRTIEASKSKEESPKPSSQQRNQQPQSQEKKSSQSQQRPKTSSQAKTKRKAPPAKMPYDDMYVGDRIQGPFYVVRNNWVGDHYWVHLSTPHRTRLRDFVVRSPNALPVGSSFNSGILLEKFLNTFFLQPYD